MAIASPMSTACLPVTCAPAVSVQSCQCTTPAAAVKSPRSATLVTITRTRACGFKVQARAPMSTIAVPNKTVTVAVIGC